MQEEDILSKSDKWYINEVGYYQAQHIIYAGKDLDYNAIIDNIDSINVHKLQKRLSDELIDNQINIFKNLISTDKFVSNKFDHIYFG
mmetsp:Transcript_14653/g.13265  ORF Transcript_14653/g.13265 Transcript_14653/m.13265 type:complete len:87 (-) Transcript_14653:1060-1320(-)